MVWAFNYASWVWLYWFSWKVLGLVLEYDLITALNLCTQHTTVVSSTTNIYFTMFFYCFQSNWKRIMLFIVTITEFVIDRRNIKHKDSTRKSPCIGTCVESMYSFTSCVQMIKEVIKSIIKPFYQLYKLDVDLYACQMKKYWNWKHLSAKTLIFLWVQSRTTF